MFAQRKVLVLDQSFTPMNVITLERALKKLTKLDKDGKPKAEIIECVNGSNGKVVMTNQYVWEQWQELSPSPDFCTECRVIRQGDEIADGHKCCKCNTLLGEEQMRSVNAAMRVPVIIRYTKRNKEFRRVQYNRHSIYRRDECTCQYCGVKRPKHELSLDHVIPRCQGGKTNWENIVVACTECNTKKAGRTPQEARMTLRRQPKRPTSTFLPEAIHKDWMQFLNSAS